MWLDQTESTTGLEVLSENILQQGGFSHTRFAKYP